MIEEVLYARVLNYLTIRPRSEKEIRDYLEKKLTHSVIPDSDSGSAKIDSRFPVSRQGRNENDNEIIEAILAKLKAQKFLNDEEFARMWIRNRTEFKPKGWRLIKMELKQKGIDEEILKKLELGMKSEGEEKRDEKELAIDLLQRKKRKYEGMGKQERFNKAGMMLAGRGFSLDTIRQAIDSVFEK